MNGLLYFFWSSVSLTVFYLFYEFMLKREQFFLMNRIYLLASLGISLLIPLIDFSHLLLLPKSELILSTRAFVHPEKMESIVGNDRSWIFIIYWIGVLLSAILLFVKLWGVKKQLELPARSGTAYSFWRSKVIDPGLDSFETIDAHENIHIQQLHTLDILFVEFIAVFFWFNPLIFLYRNSLKLTHEYLADAYAAKKAGSKRNYAMLLFLRHLKAGPALTNTFQQSSLLQARIKMLQRNTPNKHRSWRYLLCIPLMVMVTMMSSFRQIGDAPKPGEIDHVASFPGGFDAFRMYLIENARKVSAIQGKVTVSFMVDENGKISKSKVESSLDEATDKEALRIINLSPKWNAATQDGKPVRSAYQLDMNF